MKTIRWCFVACLFLIAHQAQAVSASSDGTGQVLIYPYYATGNLDTVMTVTNTTVRPKALKLTVREAKRGLATLSFNIYLRGGDSWSALLGSRGDGSPPFMSTSSRSCTVPSFFSQRDGDLPNSAPTVNLRTVRVQDDPDAETRISEGFIEVIEMGELIAGAAFLTNVRACNNLIQAWLPPTGFWDINPGIAVTPPGGGLEGSAELFSAEDGLTYTYQAVALDNFSQRHLHAFPGDTAPELRDANHGSVTQKVIGSVAADGGSVELLFDTGIEAVSAALSQASLSSAFTVSPTVDATSDIILTLPTRRFFEDPALADPGMATPGAPFVSLYSNESGAPLEVSQQLRDTSGNIVAGCSEASLSLPWATQVLSLGAGPVVNSSFAIDVGITPAASGRFELAPGTSKRLDCGDAYGFRQARVASGASQGQLADLTGLPIIGIRLQRTRDGFLGTGRGSQVRMPFADAASLSGETSLSISN